MRAHGNRARLVVAALTLVAAHGAMGQACGDPDAGSCFIANSTPACDDEACCEAVCAIDPFCCDTAWDQICADEALLMCPIDPGACCIGGSCIDGLLPTECEAQGGVFRGSNTLCADTSCGACCLPDGLCVDGVGPDECQMQGGVYQGDGTACDGFSCPGACCVAGTCIDGLTQPECAAQGGVYQGLQTICANVACPGACCLPNGLCLDAVEPGDCLSQGGVYQGDGTACDGFSCPGACCVGDACIDGLTQPECDAQGGLYRGLDTICADVGCPGACCLPDGLCLDALEPDDCFSQGGVYQGDGTTCDEFSCAGACCLAGTCIDGLTQPQCAAQGGFYQGLDTACAGIECPPAPPNDLCASALPISEGGTDFSTVWAGTDGPAHPECQFDGQTYNDIWYMYTASCTGAVTVTTCNQADYDTDLVVYDGCDCGDLVLLGCNDDDPNNPCGGSPTYHSTVTVPVVAGSCYLIRVGGWNEDDSGSGTLSVQCDLTGACCLPNDLCIDAVGPADCQIQGGVYQGDETNCGDLPCVGACCIAGTCVDGLTQPECDAQGGTYLGLDTMCASVGCPGACCLPDGLCLGGVEPFDCQILDGIYQGDDTTCSAVSCPDLSPCETELLAPDGAAEDGFGVSVAVSGDAVIVGAHGDDVSGSNSGSAYVLRRSDGTWFFEQKLTAPDGATGDYFGWSVAVDGDVAIAGASGDDDQFTNSGAAYVFRRLGGAWLFEQKLTAPDGAPSDYFGTSVDIEGDVAIVGAMFDDDSGDESGSAWVFRFDGGTWTPEQKLTADDGAPSDVAGESVAIDGDLAIVGAPGDDDQGAGAGSAYVFRYLDGSWDQEQKIVHSDGGPGDQFGEAVAIAGDLAAVGSMRDDDQGGDAGAAYVFRFVGGSWMQEEKLLPSDGSAGDQFGGSVAIGADRVIVGASRDDDHGPESGSAYVFVRTDGIWSEKIKLRPTFGAPGDLFGTGVAISDDLTVAGSPMRDGAGTSSGAAFEYDLTCLCAADLDGSGDVDVPDLAALIGAWGACPPDPCPADLNGDGLVDVDDLLELLGTWGPCP